MIKAGQIVLFSFPQTNLVKPKLRPALLIQRLPGKYNDWLTCMISSKIAQEIPEFDELLSENDNDYPKSGLKVPSLIRISRLAIQDQELFLGTIGEINFSRLNKIREKLSFWINPSIKDSNK